MKISYILQTKDFLILFVLGFLLAILYDTIIKPILSRKVYLLNIILETVFILFLYLIFVIAINYINFGEFRTFLIIAYILGYTIERITIGKLFAKGTKFVYNLIVIIIKKFSHSKIGRFILK